MSGSASSSPRSALLLKTDTLGDLVLFAPALRALREAWPQARITVVIRRAYLELAPSLAPALNPPKGPGIEWLTTTLDPFSHGPGTDPAELTRLRDAVAALAPDLIAAATSRRNWLDAALAATAAGARRVALGDGAPDEIFSTQLRVSLGIEAATVFGGTISAPADEPDWQRNLRLAGALVGRTVARAQPAITPDPSARDTATAFLAGQKLAPRQFVVCAAAGFANVKIKTWPAEKFGAALTHLRDRHGLRTLLVGHESEHTHLAAVCAAAPGSDPVLWLGGDGSLPVLTALIAESALYFGNDTGAMHLAAALDVPVVAVFGGGTWPRFIPAARRAVSLVQPLPCFGCGWECAFGDAPCLATIAVEDATAALDFAVACREPVESANRGRDFAEVRTVERLPAATRDLMGATAARFRTLWNASLSRQHQIEGKDAAILEKERALVVNEQALRAKEAEIVALKTACDERLTMIHVLDAHVKSFQAENVTLKAGQAVADKVLAALSPDGAKAAEAIASQAVHIRNLESILRDRERQLAEFEATRANLAAGLAHLEQAKHYGRLLAEKEAVIQSLSEACAAREAVIGRLTGELSESTSTLHKLWVAASAHVAEKWWRPFEGWLFQRVVEDYWMQIGVLRHYEPRPLAWDPRLPGPRLADDQLPQIALVTPSYGQEKFIERTMLSVLDQHYPKLLYAVQDGGSKDRSAEIIARHAARLRHWASVRDHGQADAVRLGFDQLTPTLRPDDVMAYLNSDDLLAPRSLRGVAEYFATHPDVDVVYGHRIIIDDDDREIGRWVMPRHHAETLAWIDYVPQETMFWRKRAWELAGGIDPSFQFALDWDLLARFQQAGCRMVRLPYFLAAFRVHAAQKTSQDIHTTGAGEMARIRARFHGERQDDHATINRFARRTRFRGALVARLLALGLRW